MNLSSTCNLLIQASCANNTWKQYNYVIKQFYDFCTKSDNDHANPTIELILNFLTSLFDKGASYATINTARSALATHFGTIDGQSIGDHPLISRVLKGVSRLRPPRAKYQTTWDTQQVLSYLSKQGDNQNLSIRMLTKKLAALLALCSGQRVQTLSNIKISEIQNNSDKIIITVEARLKTSKPGIGTCIELPIYIDDPHICVVQCLQEYLKRTEEKRESEFLFIQTRLPHKTASSQTISKWLKEVLKESNIDINKFSSHSYRHASTSKANVLGVSIDTIFHCAGWSNSSKVFASFYKRPIIAENNFAKSILTNSVGI